MNYLRLLLAAAFAFSLAGCTPPDDHYPVSGEECKADDPVLDMDASDLNCLPPA